MLMARSMKYILYIIVYELNFFENCAEWCQIHLKKYIIINNISGGPIIRHSGYKNY